MQVDPRAEEMAARFGATSFGRSAETGRRRDSFLLVGLLLLVDYLLVAILIAVDLSFLGRVALAAGVLSLLSYTIAEAMHALRPTRKSLERADRFAVISVGVLFAISVIVALVGLITGQLFD